MLSSAPRGFAARSRVPARLVVSLAQTGEPARRLVYGKWRLLKKKPELNIFFQLHESSNSFWSQIYSDSLCDVTGVVSCHGCCPWDECSLFLTRFVEVGMKLSLWRKLSLPVTGAVPVPIVVFWSLQSKNGPCTVYSLYTLVIKGANPAWN